MGKNGRRTRRRSLGVAVALTLTLATPGIAGSPLSPRSTVSKSGGEHPFDVLDARASDGGAPRWTSPGKIFRAPHSATTMETEDPLVSESVPGASYWSAYSPDTVWNGRFFLAVWQEVTRYDSAYRLMAARVSASGQLLDPYGFVIDENSGYYGAPSVTWSGERFLVAWTVFSPPRWSVQARLFDADARPLGEGDPILISRSRAYRSSAGATWDGAQFVVVWDSADDIYGARVAATGDVIDPQGTPLVATDATEVEPHVTAGGTGTLVVWRQRNETWDLSGAFLQSGTPLQLEPSFPIATERGKQLSPDVVWTGAGHFVAWQDRRHIRGALVTADGTGESRLLADGSTEEIGEPVLAWSGTGLLLSYRSCCDPDHNEQSLYRLFDGNGIPITQASTHIPAATGPRLDVALYVAGAASDGDGFLVLALVPTRDDPHQLFAVRIEAAGDLLDPEPWQISIKPNIRVASDVAGDGTDRLVVWADLRRTIWDTDVYAGRVGPDGDARDGPGILLARKASEPAVAWNGSNYLAIWDRRGRADRLQARTVVADGSVGDITTIDAESIIWNPAITTIGNDFFVAWVAYPRRGRPEIRGALIEPDGTVTKRLIWKAPREKWSLSVASSSDGLFVAWMSLGDSRRYEIFGARLDRRGRVIGAPQVVAAADHDLYAPSVASDGETFLVSYTGRAPDGRRAIVAGRVGRSGRIVDPHVVSTTRGIKGISEMAWTGDRFLIAWDEQSNEFPYPISVKWTVLGSTGAPIGTETDASPAIGYSQDPSISVASDDIAITYTRATPGFDDHNHVYIDLFPRS